MTSLNATLCTVFGLMPLVFAWLVRNRLSYASLCFIAISSCTLSTSVLADYHLLIFIVPLLLLRRQDPAFWPILLGACWVLIPKNYTPFGELSWQTYLNPAGLILSVLCMAATHRGEPVRELMSA
jgi:hypothetical protein